MSLIHPISKSWPLKPKTMFLTDIKRIFRAGFLNFWRNKFVSFAAMLVIMITLFVVGSLIFVSV